LATELACQNVLPAELGGVHTQAQVSLILTSQPLHEAYFADRKWGYLQLLRSTRTAGSGSRAVADIPITELSGTSATPQKTEIGIV
jgi:hypothetical protein